MLYKELAEKCNIPEDLAKIIEYTYWGNLRQYLNNPLKTKRAIMFPGFGEFKIYRKKLKAIYDSTSNESHKQRVGELLDHFEKWKRKKKQM